MIINLLFIIIVIIIVDVIIIINFFLITLMSEVSRLLDDNDAEMQTKVLDCLLNWKDGFLLPYEKHLKNLVNSKYLREELATWNLSEESNFVQGEHRAQLVPLVLRLLMPKVRSLKTLASRKVDQRTLW